MSPARRLLRVSVPVLTALAFLAGGAPAAAHVAAPPSFPLVQGADAGPGADAGVIVPVLSATPVPAALPWYLPVALALLAVAAWRGPRRALAVTLVLLLAVFAFEDALHSVHHGFDTTQQEHCTVAAASAQLSALPVDGVALCPAAWPVIGAAEIPRPAFALTRFLSPDQGRAPPSAIL